MHAAATLPDAQGAAAGSQSDSMVDTIARSETALNAAAGNMHACAASTTCANTSNPRPVKLDNERRPPRGREVTRSDKGSNRISDKMCCACYCVSRSPANRSQAPKPIPRDNRVSGL